MGFKAAESWIGNRDWTLRCSFTPFQASRIRPSSAPELLLAILTATATVTSSSSSSTPSTPLQHYDTLRILQQTPLRIPPQPRDEKTKTVSLERPFLTSLLHPHATRPLTTSDNLPPSLT